MCIADEGRNTRSKFSDLNREITWVVFTALSLQARCSPCPSQLRILTDTNVTCLLAGSEAQSAVCCKTCKITHKGKAEIILMREIFSAYLQGRERIWKKSVPSHLYDSAGHDHSFKDNFKVSKCLWQSLNWCLNSNSRYKCKCREDKRVLQGEMLDWPWTWKQSPWYYHRKMLDSKTSLEKQN